MADRLRFRIGHEPHAASRDGKKKAESIAKAPCKNEAHAQRLLNVVAALTQRRRSKAFAAKNTPSHFSEAT